MSLHQLAQKLAAQGRGGDTMLAHINPEEAALLKARGGSGTINPKTGLPEFNVFSRLNPFSYSNDVGGGVVGAVDDFRGSVANKLDDLGPYAPLVMGALLGPAGYGMSAMGAGLAVGATYGIANGSLKSGLRAGLSAGSGANIAGGIASLSQGPSAGAGGASSGMGSNYSFSNAAAPTSAPPIGAAETGSLANLQGTTPPTITPSPTIAPPPDLATGNTLLNNSGINMDYARQGLQDIYAKAANSDVVQGAQNMYDKALNSQFVQGTKELVTTPGAPSALIEKTGYMPYTALAMPYVEEQAKKVKDSQTEQQNALLAKAEEAKIGDIRDFTYDPKTQAFTSAGTRRVKYDPNDIRKFSYDPVSGEYTRAADGGIMGMGSGGISDLGSYSDGGRMLRGPGDGVSDSIPAMIGGKQPARLADGEFVVPARIVSELGNGSSEAGARKLYAMMDRIQKARGKTTGKNAVAKNSRAEKHLPA
jgi:hypothetical protein